MSRQRRDPPRLQRSDSNQLFDSPPFFELDRRDVLDRLVDEVLLVAAAARFAPPLFFAEERAPADFVPPRADELDFFEDERAPVLLPAFVPLRDVDLVPPFAEDFDPPRAPDFDPVLLLDRVALFFAPPLLADDLAALLAPVPDLFAAPFFAAPFLAEEVPRFAVDLVPVLLPEDDLLEPPLFVEVVVVAPPDASEVFV